MEALFMRKPAITFGHVFFNEFDDVIRLQNIEDLPQLIHERLQANILEDNIRRCVVAMYQASFHGFARLPTDCSDESLKAENVALLAKGMITYIKHMYPSL